MGEAHQVILMMTHMLKEKTGRPYIQEDPPEQAETATHLSLLPTPSISFASFMDEMPPKVGISDEAAED